MKRSRSPFNVEEPPWQFFDKAVRQLLRMFGYRQVDEVVRALKMSEPLMGDPAAEPPIQCYAGPRLIHDEPSVKRVQLICKVRVVLLGGSVAPCNGAIDDEATRRVMGFYRSPAIAGSVQG